MKTKILIIALANAMLSFGTISHAQEIKPSSAEDKTSTVQSTPSGNLTASESGSVNQLMTESFKVDALPDGSENLHVQMTMQLQKLLEIRTEDAQVCSDNPKECEYDVLEALPAMVY